MESDENSAELEEEALSKEEEAHQAEMLLKLSELENLRVKLSELEDDKSESQKVGTHENRRNHRYPIPSAFPLTFRFYTKEIDLKGKLHDISEEGCGLTILDPGYYTGSLENVTGTTEITFKGKSVRLDHIRIAHGLSNQERFGVSMKELSRYPEQRILWLETMIAIISELKTQTVWR